MFKYNPLNSEITQYYIGGPNHYFGEPNSHSQISDKSRALFQDSSNRIWAVSLKGLSLYDKENDTFNSPFSDTSPMHDVSMFAITEDSEKNLWLRTENAVIRYNPETNDYDNFATSNLSLASGASPKSMIVDQHGALYISGTDGYFTIATDSQMHKYDEIPILITHIEIDGKESSFGELNVKNKNISLTHPVNKILIDFTILDYLSIEQINFSYRIKGYMDEWTDVSDSRQIALVKLNPGNYPIEIRRSNVKGNWNDNTLSIDLIISPVWWKKPNYIALLFVVLLLSIFSTYKLRTKAVIKKNLILENLVNKKTSELNTINKQLSKLAHHDSLTGLPNRLYFKNLVEKSIKKYTAPDKKLFFVMFVDLDDFKVINDSLGHNHGDQLLIALSEKLKSYENDGLRFARIGGDEFLVLVNDEYIKKNMEQTTNINDFSRQVATEILDLISEIIYSDSHQFRVTASIGIAIYPEHGANHDILLRNADTAMYRAKKSGKNFIQIYSEQMNKDSQFKYTMLEKMKNDISNRLFEPYFQPKYSVENKSFQNVEVLTRWTGSDGNHIPPKDFIPLAEETGLIVNLENQMYKVACKMMSPLISQGKFIGRMALNLSGVQFNQVGFIDNLDDILTITNFPAKHLEIEITESVLIENFDHAIETIDKLQRRNISVTIDDFGTGYSSLSYLSKFRINKLKLDSSLIANLIGNQKNRIITETIINLSHSLGLTVVAEGVEHLDEFELLKNLKCDEIQGYYFSKAISFENYKMFLGV